MPVENVSLSDMSDLLVDYYLFDKDNVRQILLLHAFMLYYMVTH